MSSWEIAVKNENYGGVFTSHPSTWVNVKQLNIVRQSPRRTWKKTTVSYILVILLINKGFRLDADIRFTAIEYGNFVQLLNEVANILLGKFLPHSWNKCYGRCYCSNSQMS
ncbi:unnamed protein product [Lactuca virosa]|uniref:Uncharacterized protein n=1 Tax=Lactuca virosa TaxID=75947 RepID=A0AAU9MLQ7_9ASTR|nr:unnamed protein product [Lactuca virosa]